MAKKIISKIKKDSPVTIIDNEYYYGEALKDKEETIEDGAEEEEEKEEEIDEEEDDDEEETDKKEDSQEEDEDKDEEEEEMIDTVEEEVEEESETKITTDHEEIRRWAEERDGHPAAVKTKRGRMGPVRIDFPGFSGNNLVPITWDEFFKKFDESDLVFVYQEETKDGQKSNFNKLVSKSTIASEEGSSELGS